MFVQVLRLQLEPAAPADAVKTQRRVYSNTSPNNFPLHLFGNANGTTRETSGKNKRLCIVVHICFHYWVSVSLSLVPGKTHPSSNQQSHDGWERLCRFVTDWFFILFNNMNHILDFSFIYLIVSTNLVIDVVIMAKRGSLWPPPVCFLS